MSEKIEKLKAAIEQLEERGEPVREALAELRAILDEKPGHPGREALDKTIDHTLDHLDRRDASVPHDGTPGPSSHWEQLAQEVEEWEDHHPGFTLSIGRIAHALSLAGL